MCFSTVLAERREDGSGFASWKTVPAVPVPGKTVPTVPVSGFRFGSWAKIIILHNQDPPKPPNKGQGLCKTGVWSPNPLVLYHEGPNPHRTGRLPTK